jgi:hypothetical protein
MRLKQSKHPLIRAGKEPRPQQAIPTEAARIAARMTGAPPKPYEELRPGRSKGLIGPKSMPPRRGTMK